MSTSERRLKVVTLVAVLTRFGGAEHVALEMTRGLDRERFDRTLAVTRWTPAAAAEQWVPDSLAALDRAGVRFLGLDRPSVLHLWAWWPLIRYLRRERVDILHTHQFGSNVFGVIVGRLARVPVIVAHEHSWSYVGQPMRKLLDRWVIAGLADVLVAVSSEDRRRMREVEHIPDAKTALLPNGIADDPLAVTRGDVRAELGIDPGQPVVGTVSTLRPEKRVDVLVRAAAALADRVPGVRILVAGRGWEQAALEALIAELGVGGTVTLVGQRTDIPDFLAALDVAVCSSEREGSPLSVMEYMQAGLPTVATRVGGVPDLIEDGVHGRLVPSDDPDALAEAIGDLLEDPERRAEMGSRARERQRAEFTTGVMVQRLEALYERLWAKRRRAQNDEEPRPGGRGSSECSR
jgi:glycosyltransferase involved in cell wall biosynthesis